MCLIGLAWRAHPRWRLVVAANRDELYARPTAPAAFWEDAPEVLAGRDLRAGGTWMGITRAGRFAAVTNYHGSGEMRPAPRSRGGLVAGFLRGTESPGAYARGVEAAGGEYGGFNLLVGDGGALAYVSNRAPGVRLLEPGVYGLSNHLLDTPWPKVRRARDAVRQALAGDGGELDAPLLEMLADRIVAADGELPDTGVGIERARLLSPPFIATDLYGTRASTVLSVAADGEVRFVERTVTPGVQGWTEARHRFSLPR
ncbi:MAG TPA: NRDE family protein [Longimicrobium sp.]|nr:NRDE family protein [Longimicrobium sp.]